MASPPVEPAQQFSVNIPVLVAYLSHYMARQIPEEPGLNVVMRMPALVSDSDTDDEQYLNHGSCDGTYNTEFIWPDFDRETGDLGGWRFRALILISKLFIQVISRQLYPATSRTLEKFQFPSAATATTTLSLWDRTSVGLGTGARYAMSRCGPPAICGPRARTPSILTLSKTMALQLEHLARPWKVASFTVILRRATSMPNTHSFAQ
jgi:hypothetical protein